MINLISFRPGVISNNTAFEPMALIYKYLQDKYNYSFTIIKAKEDDYYDPAFKIFSISKQSWQVNPYLSLLSLQRVKDEYLASAFNQAHGVLTVDPTVYAQGVLAIQKAYQLGKPVWFDTSMTLIRTSRDFDWKLKRRLLIKVLNQTTGIIATVPKCIERFQDLCLFDEIIAPKFTIMGHPVDTTRFLPQPKPFWKDEIVRVLVVSRMVPEKGLFYILEAMTTILKNRNDVQLQLLGSGPMKSLLVEEVEKRDLMEKVVFLNPVSHEELPSILGAADVFVNHAVSNTHWEEFFGAINIEAMSCGLPCVLTSNGGISYTIREGNVAKFVEERNIIQLREAIIHFLDSKKERCEMGQRARSYVEHYYALPIIAEEYHRMLQRGFAKKIAYRTCKSTSIKKHQDESFTT